MNVMHQLTLKTLKMNRRRTVVTVLGTAVAVAMVTAIAVLVSSLSAMIRADAQSYIGHWHASLNNIDFSTLEIVDGYQNAEFVDVEYAVGFAPLEGQEERTRQALWLNSYEAGGMQHLPVTLLEGHYPTKYGEILVDESLLEQTGWQLGDTVTLDMGFYSYGEYDPAENYALRGRDSAIQGAEFVFNSEGAESFTIVGVADLGSLGGFGEWYTAITAVERSQLAPGDYITANIGLRKARASSYEEIEELMNAVKAATLEQGRFFYGYTRFNSDLLLSEGLVSTAQVVQAYGSFLVILLGIVLVGSVGLIRNAFSISLGERVRWLGMMAGVGATRRQKRASVFFEALVIGGISLPLGILGGIAGIWVTLQFVGETLGDAFGMRASMQLDVPLWAIAFTVLFSAFILLVSAVTPARRASRISPVEAMRGGEAKDTAKRKIRVNPLMRLLGGYEAELGIKNSKRNRKRYLAILSSLVISVVLFLTVTSAMDALQDSVRFSIDDGNATLTSYLHWTQEDGGKAGELEEYLENVRQRGYSGETALFVSYTYRAHLAPEMLPDINYADYSFGEWQLEQFALNDRDGLRDVSVIALDEQSFAAYCAQLGVQVPESGDALQAILYTGATAYTPDGRMEKLEAALLQEGDEFSFSMHYNMDDATMRVAAVADTEPDMFKSQDYLHSVVAVVRLADLEAMLDAWMDPDTTRNAILYSNTPQAAELYNELEASGTPEGFDGQSVYNLLASVERNQKLLDIVALFCYGFVVLISLVCLANIFNTVSTGVQLRAREFAILRSMGLTGKGFNRMMDCETLLYGVKALVYGIPISFLLSFWLRRRLTSAFPLGQMPIPWLDWLVAAVGIFLLVGSAMLYARSKVRSLNIAETLKNENW